LKIFTYTVYSSNKSQERSDGVAIAIKNDIPHKIINNFTSDLLAVEVNTPQGPIILATLYIPPRRQYILEPDILQLLRHNKPIYIMGDFNAHHTLFGYNDTNAVGRGLASYIQQGRLTHLGPHTPTYIAHHAATTPDIVLANHRAHLHYHITTDDVTSSDHLPVIITLSTNPIMTPTQPRESFKHANWEGFKQALENTQVIDLEGQPTHMINNHLEQWYTDIQTAREANIPKTTYKTIPHYRETHHLKLLKIQYRHLHELSITRGWDAQLRTRYREIQTQLTHEVRVMSNQHWETLARKLCQNTKDPKKFWSSFKMLMGSNRQTVSYIYNAHRQRVNSVEGMEALHREFWQQNFQISPAENARFDNTTETEVTNYLQQHRNLTLPENIITQNNLTEDSPFSKPNTPAPTPYNNYSSYADDITQIISHPSKSQHIMKLTTQRAIQNINTFEHHWKIQTNMNKFKLIHIARRYSQPITINNTHIPYSNRGNILGFHLSTTGFTTHIKQRITQARTILTKLRRFSCCTPRTKLRLYKTTVRPILEYTAVPLVAISHSQKLKMQSVQNKALLWVHGATRLDFISSETLHRTYSIEPLNTRIHRRAQNTWARLREQEDANYNNIIDRHTNTHNNHTWWPRTLPITETPTPAPIYASTH